MNIQLRVLPFVALVMSTGSAFATFDPFDPELFLSPYGEVVTSIITTEVVGAGTSDAGMTESPVVELMSDSSPEERVLEDRQAETGALDGPAVELALQAINFIHDEAEVAALIAADLAALSETTGSIQVAEPTEMLCVEGYEDR
jgi:hypothetical protein